MGSTFMRMDVIGKTHDGFVVACGILHGYFNGDVIHFTVCVDRCFKNDIFIFVDVFHITCNPTFIVVMLFLVHSLTLVGQGNTQASVQEG